MLKGERALQATVRDITDRKRVEEAMRAAKEAADAANRAKSTFLASMSHELRTPLNAILGYSEMLREDAQGHGLDEMVADVNKIHAAGSHLLSLINDILDLSKIEAGRMELFLESFEVAPMLSEVAETVRDPRDQEQQHAGGPLPGRHRRDARRPHAHPPGALQPHQQRLEVHPGRHHYPGGGAAAGVRGR